MITNATSFERDATNGAMTAPSLWPDQADFVRGDLGARLKEVDASLDIFCKVFRGGVGEVAGGLADPAIIHAQHGDAGAAR
jgi:hypothetical protein